MSFLIKRLSAMRHTFGSVPAACALARLTAVALLAGILVRQPCYAVEDGKYEDENHWEIILSLASTNDILWKLRSDDVDSENARLRRRMIDFERVLGRMLAELKGEDFVAGWNRYVAAVAERESLLTEIEACGAVMDYCNRAQMDAEHGPDESVYPRNDTHLLGLLRGARKLNVLHARGETANACEGASLTNRQHIVGIAETIEKYVFREDPSHTKRVRYRIPASYGYTLRILIDSEVTLIVADAYVTFAGPKGYLAVPKDSRDPSLAKALIGLLRTYCGEGVSPSLR